MAPITIDGTDVSTITVDGQDVSEITADGDVVYTAIPDSGGDHQWNVVEGSGTTISDVNGSLNADFSSLSWVTGAGTEDVHIDVSGGHAIFASSNYDFVMSGSATFFFAINPDTTTAPDSYGQSIFASTRGGSNNFSLELEDGGDWLFFLRRADGTTQIEDPSVSDDINNWTIISGVVDEANSNQILYKASPANNYTVTEIASGTPPATTSNSLENDVGWMARFDGGRYFDGQGDYGFTDNSAYSQSELQSIVDDLVGYY